MARLRYHNGLFFTWCFDWLDGLNGKFLGLDKKFYHGKYLFTIDSCHADTNILNVSYSEVPEEHKSFNILELDNGHFAAQPNNRCIFYDKSLSPSKMTFPDYKVSTMEFQVEANSKWTAGDTDDFFYEFKKDEEEEDIERKIEDNE